MSKLSTGQYFKRLNLIFSTIIFIQLIFILMVIFLRTDWQVRPDFGKVNFLRYVAPLFAGYGLYQGNALFRRWLKRARQLPTLNRKLASYQRGLLLRYGLWMAPSLVAIAAYFLSGSWLYLALSGLIIVVFLINRPGMERVRRELEL